MFRQKLAIDRVVFRLREVNLLVEVSAVEYFGWSLRRHGLISKINVLLL